MEKVTTKKLALFTGRTHPALAEEVATHLGQPLGEANIVEFANGEIRPRFAESVRGSDVFVMQSHYGVDGRSINDSIVEQLTMIDAAYRASAKRITAVRPRGSTARSALRASRRSAVSRTGGETAWLNEMTPARSTGFRPSRSASPAAMRSVSRRPRMLALESSASTALIGTSAASTTSTRCRTPLSRSSKSLAVRPPTGLPPSSTSTSTRTPSVREENA